MSMKKSADMIAMQVGNENAVDGVILEAGVLEMAADRLAAIDQEVDLAETVEKGGVRPVSTGPTIADAKTV